MKRHGIVVVLLGASAVLGFVAHGTLSVVRADLPQLTATQIYQPSFDEWAFLSLTASYRDYGSQTHFVSVARVDQRQDSLQDTRTLFKKLGWPRLV